MNNDFEQFIDFVKEINNNFCLLITASNFETNNLAKIIEPHIEGVSTLKFIYKGNNYTFGKIEKIYVLNVECTIGSSGKNGSTLVTFDALYFNPKMTFLVGIAFGNKNYSKIGDIVVSTNIYDYEKCVIKDDADEIEKIKSAIKQPYTDCNEKICNLLPDSNNDLYSVKKGTIISGEKLCASETFLNRITSKVPTIWVGGEMEAIGFASACLRKKYDNWCVIKAVSDFGDKKKRNNKQENQTMAIENLLEYLEFVFSDLKKFDNLEDTKNNQIENSLIKMFIEHKKLCENNVSFSEPHELQIYSKLNLPCSIISRSEMDDFIKIISTKNWVNVYGSALSGKTILVKQFIIQHGNYYYLNLSNIIDLNKFFNQIKLLVKDNKFNDKSIMVLDDFPKLYSYDPFIQSLIDLIEILEKKNIKVITIQNEKISNDILDYFNIELFSNFCIENIKEVDIYSFFDLYKVPKEKVSKKEIELILAICKKKIYLLNQLFQYFKINNWNISSCILDALLQRNKIISTKEVQLLLLDKIIDEQSRELLYRMSQIIEPISYDTLVKIANIEPSIPNINEKLSKLSNIWIMENEEHKYYINDNIKKITELNINSKVKESVNSILGDKIISKRILNQLDVCNVIIHFCLANRYDEAAEIYVIAMQELINENAYFKDYLFTGIWKNIKLPREMSFKLQLDVRIRQIVYFKQQNIQLKETIELSKELFDNPQCPVLIKFGIPLLVYDIDFQLSNKYILECIKYSRNQSKDIMPIGSPIFKICNMEQIILMITLGIKDINDIIIWLNNFLELSSEEINRIFDEKKTINGVPAKELFNYTLEIFKFKIKNNKEFILLAETYLKVYKNVKEKHNEFLKTIFLRQLIQILIGKLNIEIISILDIEQEIDSLPNDISKMLIIITLVEEYKKINSIEYDYWNKKYTSYIFNNKEKDNA